MKNNQILIDALKEIDAAVKNPDITMHQAFRQVKQILLNVEQDIASCADAAPQEASEENVPEEFIEHHLTKIKSLQKELKEKMGGQVTGKSAGKQELTDLRNSFYDSMPSSGEIKAWDMIEWATGLFVEFDIFIDAMDESGEAGKQPEQQEINPGFLEGLKKEPLNAIRTLILMQLSEEEKAALLRWLTPEQQPAVVSPDSDALASPPNFDQLVSMIEKLFYDYQEDVLKASKYRIDKAWTRYRTLNHLYRDAPGSSQTEVPGEQKNNNI